MNCCANQITSLDVSNNLDLTALICYVNQITNLDLSGANALTFLDCKGNNLTTLDLRNGNNLNFFSNDYGFYYFSAIINPSLTCINVDDAAWSTANWNIPNWSIDPQHYFSANCSTTSINEQTTNKELLKVIDILGGETKGTKNEVLFYIYDDGTVEKRIVIE